MGTAGRTGGSDGYGETLLAGRVDALLAGSGARDEGSHKPIGGAGLGWDVVATGAAVIVGAYGGGTGSLAAVDGPTRMGDPGVAPAAGVGSGAAGEAAVLLSPACASYDQFKDFEQRGDIFRDLVAKLPQGAKSRAAS